MYVPVSVACAARTLCVCKCDCGCAKYAPQCISGCRECVVCVKYGFHSVCPSEAFYSGSSAAFKVLVFIFCCEKLLGKLPWTLKHSNQPTTYLVSSVWALLAQSFIFWTETFLDYCNLKISNWLTTLLLPVCHFKGTHTLSVVRTVWYPIFELMRREGTQNLEFGSKDLPVYALSTFGCAYSSALRWQTDVTATVPFEFETISVIVQLLLCTPADVNTLLHDMSVQWNLSKAATCWPQLGFMAKVAAL